MFVALMTSGSKQFHGNLLAVMWYSAMMWEHVG